MTEIKWYFPESREEARKLLQKEKTLAHAGGTSIINNPFKTKELVDLSLLGLDFFESNSKIIKIGSMNTYAGIVDKLKNEDSEHLLVKSLEKSANTPLRNRITIGGSVAAFPVWSDLMAALIALKAKIHLQNETDYSLSVEEYLNNKKELKKSLITQISFANKSSDFFSYRFVRTSSDMPFFHLAISSNNENTNIVVTGTSDRYNKLTKIEEYFADKKSKIDKNEIKEMLKVEFKGARIRDKEYLKHILSLQIYRGLTKLKR